MNTTFKNYCKDLSDPAKVVLRHIQDFSDSWLRNADLEAIG